MKRISRWLMLVAVILTVIFAIFLVHILVTQRLDKISKEYDIVLNEQELTLSLPITLTHDFPASTSICGIKLGDTFAQVMKQFGNHYLVSTTCENDHAVIAYQDPVANLEITFFGKDKKLSPNNEVDDISFHEDLGEKDPEHLATRSFANLGDIHGIKLGSTLADIEKVYGKIPADSKYWRTRIKVPCSQTPKSWLLYELQDGKVAVLAAFIE